LPKFRTAFAVPTSIERSITGTNSSSPLRPAGCLSTFRLSLIS
jgi:hypothetical protein